MIERSPNWISARVDEEIVMMSVDRGAYLGLNPVGARIWELLETPKDAEGLCAALTREYAIDMEACRKEIGPFLAELLSQGLVVESPACSA